MAKRRLSKQKETPETPETPETSAKPLVKKLGLSSSRLVLPLLLGLLTFAVYAPSLRSDFVYDARTEILADPFIHSLSNLPAVFTLKTLHMPLFLGTRPGALLYLMANAAVWDRNPFGYHLSGILLHALNVTLLCLLLRVLAEKEFPIQSPSDSARQSWGCAIAALIFAIHPVNVESVAEVSYSSVLLVQFFILSALLVATAFVPRFNWRALLIAAICAGCSLAAAASKETGIAVCIALVVYWFIYRWHEPKPGWIVLLGSSIFLTVLFLAARFAWIGDVIHPASYLGGSLGQVFLLQPTLWIFMLGKLLWPTGLSADYTPSDVAGISLTIALACLLVLLVLQGWLAWKSRMGALGVAIYWLGLAPVSNFIPLYRPLADRFYYLPLAGVALQLTAALLLLSRRHKPAYFTASALLLIAALPLTVLMRARQDVFCNSLSLWTNTLQASPASYTAADNLGYALYREGRYSAAEKSFDRGIELTQDNFASPWFGKALALSAQGETEEASKAIHRAVELDSTYSDPDELERIFYIEPEYLPATRVILKQAGINPQKE